MSEALMAGVPVVLAAVLSAWLIEGGVARRTRRAIREEHELAELLGETVEGRAMRAMMRRRVARYARMSLRETHVERIIREEDREYSWAVSVMMVGLIVLLGWVSVSVFLQGLGYSRESFTDWLMLVSYSLLSTLVLSIDLAFCQALFVLVREKRAQPVTVDPT